jgi:hypothetical protein
VASIPGPQAGTVPRYLDIHGPGGNGIGSRHGAEQTYTRPHVYSTTYLTNHNKERRILSRAVAEPRGTMLVNHFFQKQFQT